MRRALLAALLLGGCSSKEPVPEGKAVYESKKGDFSLQGPADWRVLEEQGGAHRVTFFGPPPAVETIAVYRYENGREHADVRAYAASQALAGKAAPVKELDLGGRKALELTVERRARKLHSTETEALSVRAVLLEDGSGFWALVDTLPAGRPASGDFDALVRSFKAKG